MSFKCLQRKQEFDQRQKEMEISIGNAVPKQQKPKEAEEKTKQRVQKVNTFRDLKIYCTSQGMIIYQN